MPTSRSPFVTAATRTNPALGIRGLPHDLAHVPSCSTTSSRRSRRQRAARPRTSQVMAPMIDTPDEAARLRRTAARARDRGGRRHDRDPRGRSSRRPRFSPLSTSSASAPTTSRSTRWPPIARWATSARSTIPWQPAVLRMMRLAFDAGATAGKPVACAARRRRSDARGRARRARRVQPVDVAASAGPRRRVAGASSARGRSCGSSRRGCRAQLAGGPNRRRYCSSYR